MLKLLNRACSMALAVTICFIIAGCDSNPTEKNNSGASEVSDQSKDTKSSEASSEVTKVAEKTTGYCAVGTVDLSAKTAKILLEDGSINTVKFSGNAPEKGMVSLYTKNEKDYSFAVTSMFPPFSDTYAGWVFSTSETQKRFYYGDDMYLTDKTPIFVRYSDTEWRVFLGRDSIKQNDVSIGYVSFTIEVQGLAKVLQYVMITGGCSTKEKLKPATEETTRFLDVNKMGWKNGDKDLK